MTDLVLDSSRFISYERSPFQQHQPFAPAGDQPAAIDALVGGIQDGLSFQTLLGVTGSGKTYTIALRKGVMLHNGPPTAQSG